MYRLALALLFVCTPAFAAEGDAAAKVEKGSAKFQVIGDQKNVPERYRLKDHTFDWEMAPKLEVPNTGVQILTVRFPSPVETPTKENNTVWAEYYRPLGKGPFPAVVVLDITAGDQSLSRGIASYLATNKIAALFVQMAYYGPRRPAGSDLRLLSPDIQHTKAAIRQTVLDIRRASAWLENRPEIDGKHIGILGTSLGSFIGCLSAEMEPRFERVAVLLGGGGLVDAYYDDPRAADLRRLWEVLGGTKEKLVAAIAPVDPITCAANLKDRKLLIIAAKRDDIVPPKAAENLWQATGKQKIVWYDCTHYGAALYVVPAMGEVLRHFKGE
jgi:dienelactone hydrolase